MCTHTSIQTTSRSKQHQHKEGRLFGLQAAPVGLLDSSGGCVSRSWPGTHDYVIIAGCSALRSGLHQRRFVLWTRRGTAERGGRHGVTRAGKSAATQGAASFSAT